MKEQHGVTVSPGKLRVMRDRFPERFQRAYDESALIREAYLVDGMIENANLATVGEAKATAGTIEALDADRVAEPWRVGRDLADMKAKNVDKSRLMQEKPTQIVAKSDYNQTMRALEPRFQELLDAEAVEVQDAELVSETGAEN
jgi:hypothetical protein